MNIDRDAKLHSPYFHVGEIMRLQFIFEIIQAAWSYNVFKSEKKIFDY